MVDEQKELVRELRFQYPARPWFFALSCHFVIFGIFTLFYFGKVSGQFSKLYWIITTGYIIIAVITSCDISLLFGRKNKTIILNEEGIKIKGKFVKWEEIEKIQEGPWSMRKRR